MTVFLDIRMSTSREGLKMRSITYDDNFYTTSIIIELDGLSLLFATVYYGGKNFISSLKNYWCNFCASTIFSSCRILLAQSRLD